VARATIEALKTLKEPRIKIEAVAVKEVAKETASEKVIKEA